jgi:hypothetical protein
VRETRAPAAISGCNDSHPLLSLPFARAVSLTLSGLRATDFDANESTLAHDDYFVIDELAELIVRAQEARDFYDLRVVVDGHADTGQRPEPKPPPLKPLCLERAKSVRNRLVADGVDFKIIEVKGSGATGVNPLTNEEVQKNYNKRVYFYCTAKSRRDDYGTPRQPEPEPAPEPAPAPESDCEQRLASCEQEKQQLAEDKRLAEEKADGARRDAAAAAEAKRLAEKELAKKESWQPPPYHPSPMHGTFAKGGEGDCPCGTQVCGLTPVVGLPMSLFHGLAEIVWFVAVVLYGKAVYATLLTRASLEATAACPDVDECGATMSYLFIVSLVPSVLVVVGMLWLFVKHNNTDYKPRGDGTATLALEVLPASEVEFPRWCYTLGCFLGLLLLGAQIYMLALPSAITPVLPYEDQANFSAGDQARRLQADEIVEETNATQASPQAHIRQLQDMRTGYCADNDDWEHEPDINCGAPTWLNRAQRGRTPEECCECSYEMLDAPIAFCVDTANLESEQATNYSRLDECSAVMRYAKCGKENGRIEEQLIKDCTEEQQRQGFDREGPAKWDDRADLVLKQRCRRCYEQSYHQGSFAAMASEYPEAMQTLCMETAVGGGDSYRCTYEFRMQTEQEKCHDEYCISAQTETATVGNSIYENGQTVVEDVQCDFPARLIDSAESRIGRTPSVCCEIAGMCIGNDDQQSYPDVVCMGTGMQLVLDAEMVEGRGPEACCIKTGLCFGNGDVIVEPDIVCPSPSRLTSAVTLGRDEETCCITTGMCSGNTDPAEDVDCLALGLEGRSLKSNSHDIALSHIDGDVRQCCECNGLGSQEVARPDAWCIKSAIEASQQIADSSDDVDPIDADNQCTRVMRYAGCGDESDRSDERMCRRCALSSLDGECDRSDSECDCDRCARCEQRGRSNYTAWQKRADRSEGQLLCMEEDLGHEAANRFECTYIFRRIEDQEIVTGCVDTMCAGNTDQDLDPDITCSNGWQLHENPETTYGRTEEKCCVKTGLCFGNTDFVAEPDIECPLPSRLTDLADAMGREEASCCVTSGMCAGNSNEPDVQCPSPLGTKDNAESLVGRNADSCCERVGYCVDNDALGVEEEDVVCDAPTSLVAGAESVAGRTPMECCVRTGLCVGNTDAFAEPDIACVAPAELLAGAMHRMGRSAEAGGPCCGVTGMCAGNTNSVDEPDVVCNGEWELIEDASVVLRGSPEEEGWRCCHTPCDLVAVETMPMCRCGDVEPAGMDASMGQVLLLALTGVVLAILRVRISPHCPHPTDQPPPPPAYACSCMLADPSSLETKVDGCVCGASRAFVSVCL